MNHENRSRSARRRRRARSPPPCMGTSHHHGDHHHHHHDGPWKLNVQGVIIESPQPEIVVRQAIKQAGFNPDTPWIIVLKVAGEPKREVDLSFVIDLRHKGIEKLRLTPRQINNGEMCGAAPRRIRDAAAGRGASSITSASLGDAGRCRPPLADHPQLSAAAGVSGCDGRRSPSRCRSAIPAPSSTCSTAIRRSPFLRARRSRRRSRSRRSRACRFSAGRATASGTRRATRSRRTSLSSMNRCAARSGNEAESHVGAAAEAGGPTSGRISFRATVSKPPRSCSAR